MRAVALGAIASLLIGISLPARAQPVGVPSTKEAEARALYDKATTHFNLGEYAEAAEAFRAAYELSQAPALLFNLGQAYRLRGGAGSCAAALRTYQSYLRLDPKGRFRTTAEKYVPAMDTCAKAEDAATPATVPHAAPPPAPAERIVVVERPGPARSTGGLRVAGWVSLAVGGVGLIAGTASGIAAVKKGNALEGPCRDGCPPELHDDNNTYGSLRTFSTIGFAVGAAGVISGAVLLWSARRGDESASPHASISISPGHAGVFVRGAF